MSAKVFFRQDDPATAKHISETLGYRSGYSHSETLRDGEVSSEGRSETAVAVLTPREIMELDTTDVLFLFANFKPGRGKRMEYWRFPALAQRRAIPPPPVKELPPVDIPLPPYTPSGTSGDWGSRGGGLRFPIDPDDFN
jgi:type IV secretory pathway TraG/TraD family ATPase VirD4